MVDGKWLKPQAEQKRIEALLLEALKTPSREMTVSEWDDIRREALERLGTRKSG